VTGRILILGGPGAGKGTQALKLAGTYGWAHISTGDIFRAHQEQGTEFGNKIGEYLKAGELVPDALVCEIVVDRLSQSDCDSGYILDGFPRSVAQGEELDRLLEQREEALDAVVVLEVSDDEIVARLTARRSCPACGRIYNEMFNPPVEANTCDEAACEKAELIQRDDDQEDTIRHRLDVYHESTEPLIEHYESRGLVKRIDGAGQAPDAIAAKIEEILMTQGAS